MKYCKMPIFKNLSKHIKVRRPNNSRYAEGAGKDAFSALLEAQSNFQIEFGQLPKQEEIVIEIVGTSYRYTCQIFEIK